MNVAFAVTGGLIVAAVGFVLGYTAVRVTRSYRLTRHDIAWLHAQETPPSKEETP